MSHPLEEWITLPKGTYAYHHDGKIAEVWMVSVPKGVAWKWTIRDEKIYLDQGQTATLDEACEQALRFLKK